MFLKRIELHGFKSFAESTVVTFEPSITAIVGPNGSGKSNIVDAIRWVLGEQSAKNLRGSKMEDVIFAGTDKRKPMNIAEVRLILDNSDGTLPIEFSEVSIGRRVDRSGQSDYLINGTVCRLKDIEELLMDTGIGKEAYSIVSQGKVDMILSSKPTDRRELFEEAAGIIKYKNRKREAAKKLEDTEINLARVQDIIQELERQAEPLKKQAEDARKYKEFKKELKELEESLLLTNWYLYQKELDTYVSDRDRLARNLKERENMVNAFETKVDKLQNELDQVKELIDKKQQEYFDLKTHRESIENQIKMIHEKLNSLLMQKKRIRAEISEREDSLTRYKSEKEEINRTLSDLKNKKEELNQSILVKSKKIDELNAEIKADQEKIDFLKNDLKEFLNQRSELKTQLSRYQDQESKLTERIDELIQLRSRNDRNLDEAVTQLNKVKQELKQINERLERLKRDEEYLRHRQEEDRAKLQKVEEEFASLREKLHGAQSRLKLLNDMEESLQGYYQGVKNVLKARDELKGIVGVVAELFDVDKDKEKAIAAALGSGLQNIVVETGEDAKEAIQYLKRTRGGRATFLPLDMIQGKRMKELSVLSSIDGYLGVASDFVRADARLTSVVNYLLGRIIIAKDLDSALQISRAVKQRFRIVTLDGDNINPGGAVSGGSSQQHNHNLLGRSREIEELRVQVNHLKEELQFLTKKGQELKKRVLEQEEKLNEWQKEIHQLELKRANLLKDKQQLQKDTEYQEDLLSNMDQEFEFCHEQLGKFDHQIQQLKTELELLNSENARKEAELKALEEKVNQKRGIIDQIQLEITEIRIKLASLDEQEKGYYNRLQQIKELKEEINQKIEKLKDEWQELESKKLELEEQIEVIKKDKEKVLEKEKVLGDEVTDLKQKEKDLVGAFRKEDARARKIRRKVNELTKEINQYEVKIAEYTSKLENIKEELKEEHGIDLEHYCKEIKPVEDIEKVEKRIKSLKWRLKVLGAVNLTAEEEYETLTKRLNFIKEQHDDLIKARKSLNEMISELDETIKERFLKTFEKVQVEFKEVFTRLFGGGTAELSLSDPDNLLETGIEINAQPPGKKLQKLTLMSGGEKALTALALIFAFLKVKPSPFYILDEIDAPLDEANVERFANFVREFSSVAQFIIITHRKRTMAEADALYGVTMEESGVSKLISYKFAEKVS
ncbi:chromosome segregation protein SMC [Anoxybacter fermentans]|uniref:Chromosome partition protein Smc n=1 Tax=Anoxybacter fermentans TaxID=1323375 RepID=A0A3Q9HP81_9FIRM|nr:chromosome segregation protein SMC [Anoxybacter fermentans]AZR72334.1 chromosome segregation protein SMC [Anoxybacter fermentans]